MRVHKFYFVLAALLLLASFAPAATPTFFTSMDDPSGVAATQYNLYATEYCGDQTHVFSIDPAGNKSIFATLPGTGGGCLEKYIAIAPGLGGFPPNYLYITQGRQIIQVSADGTNVSVFTTIPGLPPSSANGITFDRLGNFGYNMLVTGFDGNIWQVNAAGQATLLANIPTHVEGPAVAPSNFAPYGGQLMVAAEDANQVYAVTPAGGVNTVGSWVGSEYVNFVPSASCEYSTSGGGYFTVTYPDPSGNTGIYKFPASDFAGLSDNAIVPSEKSGGMGLFTSTGSGISTSTFQTDIGVQEGSGFVDCAAPF
ncbi:MAG TPA: hypothetical protein VKT29_11210, partial [Terriglobales bacterium]|nr:hypothetical protein [Terriglobales bacterium]